MHPNASNQKHSKFLNKCCYTSLKNRYPVKSINHVLYDPMVFWEAGEPALILRLRLHRTGPEPFRTEPDRIGFCLHGTVWNRSRYLHGTFLEPVRIGSDTGPAKQQVRFWILSRPVLERSRVKRRPVRKSDRIRSRPIPCKHSLRHRAHYNGTDKIKMVDIQSKVSLRPLSQATSSSYDHHFKPPFELSLILLF